MWSSKTPEQREREEADRLKTQNPNLILKKEGIHWKLVSESGLVQYSNSSRKSCINWAEENNYRVSW